MVKEPAPHAGQRHLDPSNPIPDPDQARHRAGGDGAGPGIRGQDRITSALEKRWLVMGTERKTYSESLITWRALHRRKSA